MNLFEKSQWIWVADGERPDQYAEFLDEISHRGKQTFLRLSCDSDYTLYVNGVYVASGQYGDFEHYKIYDTLDLTDYLREGKNELRFLVYHCGVGTSRYRPAPAGLIYEAVSEGEVVAYSHGGILSRVSPAYASGKQVFVSVQLGFTFFYDATKETDEGYAPSAVVEKHCDFYPRPIPKANLLERRAVQKWTRYDDTHVLVDLGGEVVGVPTLEVYSETEQTLTVAWGEHIENGGVSKIIGKRHFFYEYKTKRGRNVFTDYMLRLGCRYLEVFAEEPVEVTYVGVLPQVQEVALRPCRIEGELDRRIYEVCVNTLRLCMMEHYVDCPWREQALYAFDSRNQMLCGYYAFEGGNAAYARANLKLMGEDRRPDGLLSICYPCGVPLAIPSFSLYYLVAMKEYVEHTGDGSLACELFPKMLGICEEFFAHMQDGLALTFEGKSMWNFYDWSPFSDGKLGRSEAAVPDLALNCLFVMALDALEAMCGAMGKVFPYPERAEELRGRIRETFGRPDGFIMHRDTEEYTVLGNTLAVLAGVVVGEEARRICQGLVGGKWIDCTLSMKVLEYEALLKIDTEAYREFILAEIRSNYKTMLDAGSDTVWEILDKDIFSDAGSLCHGWSAVPVYIYHRLGIAQAT